MSAPEFFFCKNETVAPKGNSNIRQNPGENLKLEWFPYLAADGATGGAAPEGLALVKSPQRSCEPLGA